jgi:hypothetical protein
MVGTSRTVQNRLVSRLLGYECTYHTACTGPMGYLRPKVGRHGKVPGWPCANVEPGPHRPRATGCDGALTVSGTQGRLS